MATHGPQIVAFALSGSLAREDLVRLCDQLRALLATNGAEVAVCDVRGVGPDAVAVDALARLQLAAGRSGCRVRLRHASIELLELVEFMGLTEVLTR